MPAGTPGQIVRACLERLRLPGSPDRERLAHLMALREQHGFASFGAGLALPHARAPILLPVDAALVAWFRLDHPAPFFAAGFPLAALCLVVAPTLRAHLDLVSRLGQLVRNPAVAEMLQEAPPAEVPERLRRVESEAVALMPAAAD
jgi:mannitol/fructose-specific phosphotransferase system IIA component (Ntr-type)